MYGVIVADIYERSDLPWQKIKSEEKGGFTLNYYANNVVEVNCGIGLTNAAAATQLLIDIGVKKIYNFGSVGAIKPLKVYDMVMPKHIKFHDVKTPWYERGRTPGEKSYYINHFPCKKSFNLASGNSFLSDAKEVNLVAKELDVQAFDMEAAAIAQVAFKNDVPFYIIKCVSDIIGENNKDLEDINARIAKAGKKAQEFVISELEKQLV